MFLAMNQISYKELTSLADRHFFQLLWALIYLLRSILGYYLSNFYNFLGFQSSHYLLYHFLHSHINLSELFICLICLNYHLYKNYFVFLIFQFILCLFVIILRFKLNYYFIILNLENQFLQREDVAKVFQVDHYIFIKQKKILC